MMVDNGIKNHFHWNLAWNECWGCGWVKRAFVISDDMAEPKMSTPISDSVECQD